MNNIPPESKDTKIEELINREITQIIALHMMNIKVMHVPLVQLGLSSAEEIQRVFEGQIARAAERIVQEVLIPELQPEAGKKGGGTTLNPDILQYVMLNFEKLQAAFLEVFKNVFNELPDALRDQLARVNALVFDREMRVALAGGHPGDEAQEGNAGAEVDKILDRFAGRVGSI